jgi:5-hydroxyisourate hydrolase-like protein (transthyretin family)
VDPLDEELEGRTCSICCEPATVARDTGHVIDAGDGSPIETVVVTVYRCAAHVEDTVGPTELS